MLLVSLVYVLKEVGFDHLDGVSISGDIHLLPNNNDKRKNCNLMEAVCRYFP